MADNSAVLMAARSAGWKVDLMADHWADLMAGWKVDQKVDHSADLMAGWKAGLMVVHWVGHSAD